MRGVLTSGARVESLVGPAGTGKSFVVGALARAWTDPHAARRPAPRRVFGLATSQIATDVLAGEGLTARNVAALAGHPGPARRRRRPSAAPATATRRGGCAPGTWWWSTSPR